jgi:hypothetical protein
VNAQAPQTEPALNELDARMEKFALARAAGLNVAVASRAACVATRTGARWGGLQAVKHRISELTREIQAKTVANVAADLANEARSRG